MLATIGSSEYRNSATAAGAAPMPRMPSLSASGTAAASAPSGAMRMPNSAIAGIVWITLSVPRMPARSRGTRWQRIPSGRPTSTAAPSEPSARQHVLAQLTREALGVHRVLAHDREVIEQARGERQHRDRKKQPQEQHPPARGRPQPRDRIGGHEPQTHQQHPEGRTGGDAHHLVARGRERAAGGGHGKRERDESEQCRGQAHPGARAADRDRGGTGQRQRAGARQKPRQRLEKPRAGRPGRCGSP